MSARNTLRAFVAPAALLFVALPCAAETNTSNSAWETALSETKPIFNARLRYEGVEQEGLPEDASALTYRFRVGFETGKIFDTNLLVEFDHVDDLIDDFNSTINSKTGYPVVADPNATELNRFQLTNTSLPDTTVTLGRQRIGLDDARFVGNVGWRQNEQTFDGARVQNSSLGQLKVDVTYIAQVNRVFGDDSPVGRWEGDSYLLNLSHPTPVGTLTGFAYQIDVDNAAGIFSSQTVGARLSGTKAIGDGDLGYTLSYAAQSDYASSSLDYSADYYLVEGTYSAGALTVGAGIEVLGGDDARGFQTPLATLHKFQGWADKFLTTPTTGVEDIYAKAAYKVGDVGPFSGVSLAAVYHDFSADVGGANYGSELDLAASAQWDKIGITLKYADYSADDFATDTSKLWIQFDFAL
jgi:hypothetical protein